MDEYSSSPPHEPPGYRLHRLEVFNWGTFDSTDGQVHIVEPRGSTTLLVGRNGSGKSTLVDSLLTLIVPNQIRNYNVAAGAGKRERDEKTYIKGACGRQTREGDDEGVRGAAVKFLRPQSSHYSALLAVFKNASTGAVFSVAQVLHVNAEGSSDKVFCFRAGEASIVGDLSGITSMERLREQMQKRGFVATKSYTEYQSRLQKALHFKSKAIDIFNQTVAVKDIESLNGFIRQHMLEQKPWREKIDALLQHFTLLSEAHGKLVEVRNQHRLLGPVKERGQSYRAMEQNHRSVSQRHDALDAFFRSQTVELLEPRLVSHREEFGRAKERFDQLTGDLKTAEESVRQLKNAIEQAGGERLKQIPLLIENQRLQANNKRTAATNYSATLNRAGLHRLISDASQFEATRVELRAVKDRAGVDLKRLEDEATELGVKQHSDRTQYKADEGELEALKNRRTNLPESHVYLRHRLCEDLRLSPNDLPFAAELMAVKQEESEWESSIELVLRGLGLSLLVPTGLYRQVSDYINRTQIRDATGQGQRLVYLHVKDEKRSPQLASPHQDSMLRKLHFREGHRLLPWLKAELNERFDYRCCSTMDEFRQAHGLAMTRERHFRTGQIRHEKNDRSQAVSRRNFVLGWDNAEKRQALQGELLRLGQEIDKRERLIGDKRRMIDEARNRCEASEAALRFSSFADIDFVPHEEEITKLEQEKRSLEDKNDVVQGLKRRLVEAEARKEATDRDRNEALTASKDLEKQIQGAETLLRTARRKLDQLETEGRLQAMALVFADIEAELGDTLTADTLFDHENSLRRIYGDAIAQHENEIAPLRNALITAMSAFVSEFKDMKHELMPTPDYLDSYLALRESIEREGLPQQEQRFKERLNEKVTHEIGLLNGALQSEQGDIVSKIDILNESLRELEYRRGTWISLEARQMRDVEIHDFQRDIKECLSGSFEGTLEADEARYLRIAKLIARLRDEPRWTEKVTDVRRWFDFVAREIDADTGAERESYSDSGGKSGGEKAKLAFTILVAAIAYQYDIDPRQPISDRFHFVVVDEMFSKVDDQYSEHALELFKKFGLQLLIVAPLDAKARITEPYVGCYLHVLKDDRTNLSEVFSMSAEEFRELATSAPEADP
ncbi:MAG: hypothetical protein IPK32_09685 [Verrucomicrobiaceae bacterium]|nr:hypothetical protein [Verrucomicrobiaceae bacterium]